MSRLLAALLVLALAGCGDAVFQCSSSADCTGQAGGFCEPNGYCSFDDPECPSGRRYGELAGDGLAGTCTPENDDGTGSATSDPPSPTTSSSSTGTPQETTTSTVETTMHVDDSTGETSDATTGGEETTSSSGEGSSSSTGRGGPFVLSFGERDDADVQGVTADAYLRASYATGNFGVHDDMHISGSGADVALLRIDVSALPAGAVVSEAELRVVNEENVGDGEVEVFALSEAWVEGTTDNTDGVCNWNDRDDGVPWTTPGAGAGSYVDDVLATFTPDTAYFEHVLAIPPELVEQWRDDPDANYGLLFRADALDNTVWLATREIARASSRPLLVVTYDE